MGRFYSFLFTVLWGMAALTAHAVNVTLHIDDPSRVSVKVNYVEQEGIVAGDNSLDVTEYYSVSIEAKSGNFLTSVVRESTSTPENIYYMTSCNIYITSSMEGETWTVTSANADEARDGSCRVYVDDASKVRIQRSGTSTSVDNLVSGEWADVKYIKGSELPLQIGSTDYGTPLYSVKLNGEPVTPEYGTYNVTPADGDEIEILANYPDESVDVHFNYATEEAKGFLTEVKVGDEATEDYKEGTLSVKLGSKLTLTGNATDYKLNSFTVNGESVSFYGSYVFTVTGETEITIDASKYAMLNATLRIDNPDHVIVYKGYSYYGDILTGLTAGDNAIEVNEANATLQIKAQSGCYITSVTSVTGDGDEAKTETYSADYSNCYTITVAEGMVITVESGAIERDKTAIVYVDDLSLSPYGYGFTRNDRSNVELADGYNVVKFTDAQSTTVGSDNPFGLSFYGASTAYVYKNDEAYASQYGGTSYSVEFADGNVLKVFLSGEPSTYSVTFDVTGDTEGVTVTRDLVKTVDNWAEGFTTLQGTQVSVKPTDEGNLEVTVDGEAVEADEEGNFTFTVNADTRVSVKGLPVDGLKSVEAGKAEGRNDIYTLQGTLVKKNATAADKAQLPAGIYIVGGKKVVKH